MFNLERVQKRTKCCWLQPLFAFLYFVFFLVVLSFIYFRSFKGLQGDALYYYSSAVSVI